MKILGKIAFTLAWWTWQGLAFAFSRPLLGDAFEYLESEMRRDTHTYLQEVWAAGCGFGFVLLGVVTLITFLVMCVGVVLGPQVIWGGKDALP